ncbi:MAG TPA: cysteine desulfurase family protein [Oligoflexia bacterium]|nr:cysteine desulfurase family protein [Oligoflexia bacterium]HMR24104.1 cysteine desulfurase family protein [Oligoflexia bacterium]
MIYLDHHATTPCLEVVIEQMNSFHRRNFANIGSIHALGKNSQIAFEAIEQNSLQKTGLSKLKLFYTSGATESINIAHLGLLEHCITYNKQIITSKIEHKATLNVLDFMQKQGVTVIYLNVDAFGRIDLDQLRETLKQQNTALVSFIHGNNEIGVIQDEQACIALAKQYGAWVHMDISQSLCVQPSFKAYKEVDMLSFSGHKIYGPKGIGGLVINETSSKRLPLKPIMYGGGEGNSLKPGTHPTALAVGLCIALAECFDHAQERQKHFLDLKQYFLDQLPSALDGWNMTGKLEHSLPHNIHLNFDGLSQDLVPHLRKIAVSSGSTCSAKSKMPSHVLTAIKMAENRAMSSIRIGLGLHNSKEHMETAVEDIAYAVKKMREKTSV